MITVSVAGETPAAVSKQLAELAAVLGGSSAKAAPAAAGKPAAASAAAKTPAAGKPAAASAAAQGGIDINALRDLGRACIKAGKNPEMKAALAELGADSITTLDPAKYAECKAKLEVILNPAEAPAASEDGL